MKKTVIGMNLKYRKTAFWGSVLIMLAMLLPYVSMEGEKICGGRLALELMKNETVSKFYIVLAVAAAGSIIMVLCGIINIIKPSVIAARIWMIFGSIETAGFSFLLFGSKQMLDSSGLLPGKFLVRDFGLGYYLALVASFVSLYAIMKMVKTNPGYIVLTILSIIWMFPILWIILTAFRKEGGYYVGYFFPKEYTIQNFTKLFAKGSVIPFGKWWMNTFIVAVCTCILSTLIILMTSYVLSRTRFAGRKTLMKIMLIIGMFPGFMSMVAVYNILKGLGLAQTLTALVVVSAAGAAMGYYICKGFFDTIPKSLDEAAIIDGATRWQIFTRITIPLSKPIIIYTILTSFLGPWTDYIFPSMVLGDKQESYTVALGLKWLTDFQRIDTYYTQFAAGALMVSVPIVILFICLQRFYVEGLSGAVKG